MAQNNKFEKQFLNALRDIFVGAKVEGDSGYVNLMRIKSRYYEQGVFPQLQKDITAALQPFPDFREELFDKLFTFFKRYFSESGSIYFRYTALHQNVYEKVYTDDRDVILFWKTHMLYYVKTDRIFTSLNVEVDGVKFFFDASKMTLKKSNEKREVVYAFRKVQPEDGTLVFDVSYSEKGKTTKVDDILKDIKKANGKLDDETLNKAFRVFEKQSEVDFFINKDARAFLQEQFDLWLYQYLFAGQNVWSAERLAQLQALKSIAYKVIDFISQFEDELVKIWNKPKFVRNSHYVLTLDHIFHSDPKPVIASVASPAPSVISSPAPSVIASPAPSVIASAAKQSSAEGEGIASGTERPRNDIFARLLAHPNMPQQVQEWRDLGMIGEDFRLEMLTQKDLTGAPLHPQYQHLPIDTKYFSDLELDILALFDDLDAALDGWLVHSENYQALNTLLPKFKEKLQTIYIDPPFNLDSSDQFMYRTNYKDANWATLLENRLRIAKDWLNEKGSIFVRCDYNGNWIVRNLLDDIFENNFINEIDVGKTAGKKKTGLSLAYTKDNIFFYAKDANLVNETIKDTDRFSFYKEVASILEKQEVENKEKLSDLLLNNLFWVDLDHRPGERQTNKSRYLLSIEFQPPKGRHWIKSQEKLDQLYQDGKARIKDKINKTYYYKEKDIPSGIDTNDLVIQVFLDTEIITDNWTDINGYSQSHDFQTENSEILLKRVIETSSNVGDFIFDFFLGSGTTSAVAHKLGRKWLGVEMGEHFYSVVLPRMKKVLAYDKTGISKEVKEYQGGGFFKYYELEQYEDVLRRAHYADADLFNNPYEDPYHSYVFLRDLKMLDSVEIDEEQNKAHFHPERLYTEIDLAETLSQRRGKWIKRITAEYVEFQDGERMSLTDPDWQAIKPLVWWQ